MISVADALAKVGQAETSGQLSPAASTAIRRWLTESPFAQYQPRLCEDIAEGRWKALDDSFFAVLEFGTGGRRGTMYPVGTNVLNDRTIAESARGLADYVTASKGSNAPRSCVIARDSRHNSEAVRRALRQRAGGRGFYGLSVPRGPLDPPALRRGAVSAMRCRHHDHRLAQSAIGQRI